jgi:hypothetical protein
MYGGRGDKSSRWKGGCSPERALHVMSLLHVKYETCT